MKKRWIKKTIASVLAGLMIVTIPGSGLLGGLQEVRAENETSDGALLNGDFEDTTSSAWTVSNGTYVFNSSDTNNGSKAMKINCYSGSTETVSFSQRIKNLPTGTYRLEYEVSGDYDVECPIAVKVLDANNTVLASDSGVTTESWDNWTSSQTGTFTITDNMTIMVLFEGDVNNYWCLFDNVQLKPVEQEVIRTFDFDTTPVSTSPITSNLYVEKVDGLTEGFITGFDISSYRSIRNSGAVYKDANGTVLDDAGFFRLLKESGVNYVRIRVWVDPTDGNGHTYGGGCNDLAIAKDLGKLATDAGLRVLIDFHYSDFWTNPGKQTAPKAWQGMELEEKAATLKTYTQNSLTELLNAGVDVGMVQIGNETNDGFCGETDMKKMCSLFKAGSEAVQEVEALKNTSIMIAIHVADPQSLNFESYAKELNSNGVVYDVFASSYYPYWHGTLDNLYSKLSVVANKYNKYVMVAETSYVHTLEDGDGHENTESESKLESDAFPYPIGLQGQALHVRNVVNTVASIKDSEGNQKGIGVFYWEPAWIPVQQYDAASDNAEIVLASNREKWETYGSGWATSTAAAYDKDVDKWYGGSAVDNEGIFDFDGTALETVKIYNMIRGGTTARDYVIEAVDTEFTYILTEETQASDIVLPDTVKVFYASGDTDDAEVKWSSKDISESVYAGEGTYPIDGVAAYEGVEYNVVCILQLVPENYLVNPSFENDLTGNWNVNNIDRKDSSANNNNMKTGSYNLQYSFFNMAGDDIAFYQTITLDCGVYKAGGYGVGTETDEFTFYVKIGDAEYTETVNYAKWGSWANPEIKDIEITEDNTEVTIGVRSTASAGGWGAFEDFYVNKMSEGVEYHILEGENSTWSSDEEGNIVIISDGPFVKFQAVKVDGKVVDPADYTAKKGSTVITFLKSYLDTLAEGTHEVEIVFTNGSAKASIAVTQKEETTTAETTTATTTTATTATTEAVTASVKPAAASTSDAATPKAASNDNGDKIATGDAHKVGLLIILLLLSASGLVITDLWKKKR